METLNEFDVVSDGTRVGITLDGDNRVVWLAQVSTVSRVADDDIVEKIKPS